MSSIYANFFTWLSYFFPIAAPVVPSEAGWQNSSVANRLAAETGAVRFALSDTRCAECSVAEAGEK